MSAEVVIVDLGMGNLRSVVRAFERVGAAPRIVSTPEDISSAPRLVVPGQGAFRDGAKAVEGEVGEALRERVRAGVPYLGLCLGMQLLFDESEEAPGAKGLGVFEGRVVRFAQPEGSGLKVPHMGWNLVLGSHAALPASAYFYFVHSFHCVPSDRTLVVGETTHGVHFASAVARDNVIACQFHPEKSQDAGESVLCAFMEDRWS
jgi:glutamine amidotransferase